MDNKTYYADVRIFVRAESAEDAAQELNDALQYVTHSAGFELCGYDRVLASLTAVCANMQEDE